jgi:2-polyprenyl-3-methyl-5-hydroxy-6-metoxy-1,4-benzoquinol methylase
VSAGLPRFVDSDGYAASFGFQWQAHARDQLDSATGSTLSRDRFFRGTGWPAQMPGELILEAGCGSGRFTEVLLSTGARVVSFDYSAAAEVAHRAFAGAGAEVCQASIYEMPYRRASFDRVFCFGVIQHCPDVHKAFSSLVEMVKPGGHLAVDVYDRRRMWLNARYRVRWLTKRMDKQRLHRWCEKVVPLYAKVMPPLHPWNQLFVPIKDYRGALPGLSEEQQIAWSVLDTFDALSPQFDQPQYLSTMEKWAKEARLVDVEVGYGGNGIELRARVPDGRTN